MYASARHKRGVGLLDSIVGVALMSIIFVGIAGVFKLSIELVSNNKARIGALALAQEQMEYLSSLNYDALGTVGGIPSGAVSQVTQEVLNGITYTRRTLIRYIDDPNDGLDANDENGVITDSKEIKVEVSWATRGQLRSTALVSRRSPLGLEQSVPGGTLSVTVINASSSPVTNALVRVVNATTSVDTQAYSNDQGVVRFYGAPASVGYEIIVSKDGYSTAQTYNASSTNASPDPGHLTVSLNQTTSATFAIDQTATYAVKTQYAIEENTWYDALADDGNLYYTASSTVSAGALVLSGGAGSYEPLGEARSIPVAVSYLFSWEEARFTDEVPPGTTARYFVYANDGGGLVSEADLPGNSAGFTTSPIDLRSLATTTYPTLRLGARLTTADPDETPQVLDWQITYRQGPVPFPNVLFTVEGEKTIGTHQSSPVLKYTANHTTDVAGFVTVSGLEFDTYHPRVDGVGLGYDISEVCPPAPHTLFAGSRKDVVFSFVPHTTHSLLVDVSDEGGVPLDGASVRLYRTGTTTTQVAASCGQTFFASLALGTIGGGNPYALEVTKAGYVTQVVSDVEVQGASQKSVTLIAQ